MRYSGEQMKHLWRNNGIPIEHMTATNERTYGWHWYCACECCMMKCFVGGIPLFFVLDQHTARAAIDTKAPGGSTT